MAPPPQTTDTAPPPTDVPDKPKPAPVVDETEKEPPKSIQEIEADLRNQGLIGDVFFDFDKSDLRSQARERLAKNAEFMNSAEGRAYTFKVEGHCDERGTNEYNLALGQNRSTTAVDYLASLGVARDRFEVISYGEERPFCTESSEACWQQNRRARFVITGN
ncbi:MAG: OmpA family protein [Acidobacteriota bacterium]